MNRIEYIAGRCWASDVVMQSSNLLKLVGGHDKLLEMLERGLVQKPEAYMAGVQAIIDIVEDALELKARRVAA